MFEMLKKIIRHCKIMDWKPPLKSAPATTKYKKLH